jgi:hypothetical protein
MLYVFYVNTRVVKNEKIIVNTERVTVATTMNYEQNQIKRLWKKQLTLQHEKQLAQIDLLAEDVQDHIDCLKRLAFSTRSRWDKYREIGYFQTDEEIEHDFQATVEYQIQYWFENSVELLLDDELLNVPGEEQDHHIRELTHQIQQLGEQLYDIMYSNTLQNIQVGDEDEEDEYVADKYDDIDEKVNKRVVLF